MIVLWFRRILQFLAGRSVSHASARDEALAKYLLHTFEEELAPAELSGFHLYVREGVVTICGTVACDADRRLLTSLLLEEAGVKGVIDHMQVLESVPADADCAAGSD